VQLIIQANLRATRDRTSKFLMGAAPKTSSDCGGSVCVFHDQIAEFSRVQRIDIALAMGTVIAHEVGHLLLREQGHSAERCARPGIRTTGSAPQSPFRCLRLTMPQPFARPHHHAGKPGGTRLTVMTKHVRPTLLVLCAALVLTGVIGDSQSVLCAQPLRPNIVLMFPDNLGWGEVGAYGSVRGQLTPRIDRLAAEGIRLNNFNVEFSCTVSRAALMT
jgi:Sulfatase